MTLANSSQMQDLKIRTMYTEMQENLIALKETDDNTKNAKEKAYLKAFISVMDRINSDLSHAKALYNNLDKEALKLNKCEKFAEEIRLFREECYLLRK